MTATTVERACKTCEHFRPHSRGGGGECHRYPPTLITYAHPAGRQFELLNAQVYDGFRCGEWHPKEDR